MNLLHFGIGDLAGLGPPGSREDEQQKPALDHKKHGVTELFTILKQDYEPRELPVRFQDLRLHPGVFVAGTGSRAQTARRDRNPSVARPYWKEAGVEGK